MASLLEPADVSGEFPALRCRDRWLALQRLRAAAGADAVLLVLGPDAQFHRGSEVAFNWLVQGLCGRNLLMAPLEKRFEECFACVRADRTVVFCKRAAHEHVCVRTAMWESCEVVVPTRQEESDQDAYDARKTAAFLRAVAGCTSIGVAMRSADEHGDLKMAVERWPLVQAHAFDEYGLGFLTMRAAVVNLEEHLQHRLYPSWDAHAAVTAYSLVPPLRKAWGEAMLLQDRGATDGTDVAAPLVDYFEYGRLALSDEDVGEQRGLEPLPADGPCAPLLDPAPRVLAGARSSAVLAGVAAADLGLPAPEPPGGGDGRPPLHAVWEAVEPLAGIAVARTYLLGGAALLAAPGAEGPWPRSEVEALARTYAAVAACCRHVLAGPALAAAHLPAPERHAAVAQAAAAYLGNALPALPGRLEVACVAIDAMGLPLGSAVEDCGVVLLYVRIALADVTLPGFTDTLGAVAYGDTVICVWSSPHAHALGRGAAVLTEQVPAFAFWPRQGDAPHSHSVKAGLDSCLGIGFDPGPSLPVGFRSGVRVYLEDRGPPPDPLGLGDALDVEVKAAVAVDVAALCGGPAAPAAPAPVAAVFAAKAWVFRSGRVVVAGPRTGHLVLQVRPGSRGLPSAEAPNGLVWVPLEASAVNAAVALRPSTASELRSALQVRGGQEEEEDASTPQAPDDELRWVARVGGGQGEPAAAALPDQALLQCAALAGAHWGQMPLETCEALFQTPPPAAPPVAAECVWVTGLPGCGALDVAAALARALGAPPPLDVGALAGVGAPGDVSGDLGALGARLAEAVAALLAQGAATVVACDVCLDPAEVLGALAAHPALSVVCCLRHAIAVLEPQVAYPWSSARHPLLLSRSRRAWASAVAVNDRRSSAGPRESSRDLDALASTLLKELAAARGSRENVFLRPPTIALVEGPLQLPQATRAQRALSLPEAAEGLRSRALLRCVLVPTAPGVPLDPAALRACCSARLQAAASGAEGIWQGLFCVEAQVCGLDAAELAHLDPEALLATLRGGAAAAEHRAVLVPRGELSPPQLASAPLGRASAGGVAWWWVLPPDAAEGPERERARREEAMAAVEACRLRLPDPRQAWRPEDVPAEDVARAEEALLAAGPPLGWFFSGAGYVDVDGREQRHHPGLPAAVEALAAAHNSAAAAWNAAVREAAAMPMFTAARATA